MFFAFDPGGFGIPLVVITAVDWDGGNGEERVGRVGDDGGDSGERVGDGCVESDRDGDRDWVEKQDDESKMVII